MSKGLHWVPDTSSSTTPRCSEFSKQMRGCVRGKAYDKANVQQGQELGASATAGDDEHYHMAVNTARQRLGYDFAARLAEPSA